MRNFRFYHIREAASLNIYVNGRLAAIHARHTGTL